MPPKTKSYHFNRLYIENPPAYGVMRLVQIGRRHCVPAETILPHTHLNWFELTIITNGEGSVLTNGEEMTVKSGDIYLSFPCDIHEIRADSTAKMEYDFFSFIPESESICKDLNQIIQNYRSSHHRIFRDERISFLVSNAISEFSVPRPDSDELLFHLFSEIILYLIRDFSDLTRNIPHLSDAEVLCYELMNYIDTHIYSLRNLEELATETNYNYRYLSTLFKQTTKTTLSEYYQNRRLEAAKVLILEKKKKIGEIAEMLNYVSLFSFSKAFKAKYGISPKNFQKGIH